MSWSRSANRRLLWSILNASSHQPSVARSIPARLSPRSLTISASSRHAGNTFSFGPEGDNVIAELASQQNQPDVSTGSATRKPRGRKAKSSQKKEVVATPHSASVDGELLIDATAPAPTPRTSTAQHHGKASEALESDSRAEPYAEKAHRSPALDEAPETQSRHEASQGNTVETPREDLRRGTRTERAQPSEKKKRGRLPEHSRASATALAPSRRGSSTSKTPTTGETQPPPPARKFSKNMAPWAVKKAALAEKFGAEGWNPRRKLSPDAMLGIRNMHLSDPVTYTTPVLATQFKVSAEAIRRILKSKWLSDSGADKMQERRERWAKRHDRIWDQQAALGLRPARQSERRVRDAAEGVDEVEHELWARETLEKARAENPLFEGK